ncbi:MAG TPA: glycosyltransferase [Xanthobacteraceae bacterium]|nr:glycosyltransferase [Xanthobacteraceae bacterium]
MIENDEDARRGSAAPLVSIVMPSYNHGRFVTDAVRSVYQQTYRPIELIIIDDGSSDGSPEIIREFLATASPPDGISVHFSARQNRGAPITINEGIAQARGSYVAILNSDDAYVPERIAECVTAARMRNSRLVFTYVEPIDAEGLPLEPGHPWRNWYYEAQRQDLAVAPSLGFVLLGDNIAVSTGNLFFRRDLFDEIGPFEDLKYAHDLAFIMKALELEEPTLLRLPLYRYRLHEGNKISADHREIEAELKQVYHRYLSSVLVTPPANPIAPTFANWPSSMSSTFGPMTRGLNRAIDSLIERASNDACAEQSAVVPASRASRSRAVAITMISHELSRSGAPTLALEVARALVLAGAAVNLISMVDGPLRTDFERAGIPVAIVRGALINRAIVLGRYLLEIARGLGRSDRLHARLHQLSFAALNMSTALSSLTLLPRIHNCVLINSFTSWPLALPIIRLRRRARISWYIHESYNPHLMLAGRTARRLFEICRKQPNLAFLFGSDGTRRVWASHGCDGQVRYWSGISAATARLKPAQPRTARQEDNGSPRIVLSVGNSGNRKGTRTLIEAFAYGRSRGLIPDDVELVIIGCSPPSTDPQTRDLLVRIHRPDLNRRVRLVGILESSAVERYYDEAAIYVQSSTMECLPLALLTAMARGLPIVTTDVDGCSEAILNGVCGLTVPPRDIPHLASAIGRLLADPTQARIWGEAARQRFVRMFSLEATAGPLLQAVFPDGVALPSDSLKTVAE